MNQFRISQNRSLLRRRTTHADQIEKWEIQRVESRFRAFCQSYPKLKYILAVSGGFSIFLALVQIRKQSAADKEINFRKSQLQKPIINCSDQNGTSFPWSDQDVDQWLFRPVQVTGRYLHNKTIFIPNTDYRLSGYEYIVPLCTKETEQGDCQEGIFVNKGFIPKQFKLTPDRSKIENSFLPETVTGYVSQLSQFQEHSAFQSGNTVNDYERNVWSYADLPDMAKTAGLKNADFMKLAVIEKLQMDSPLDERDMRFRNITSEYKQDYPYEKTQSGALQLKTMPWHYQNKSLSYINWGLLSFALSVMMFVAK